MKFLYNENNQYRHYGKQNKLEREIQIQYGSHLYVWYKEKKAKFIDRTDWWLSEAGLGVGAK